MSDTPTIVITNLKGGVGKSTVTGLTALGFAEAGFKVGLRDTDVKQRTLTKYLERPAFLAQPNIQPAPPGANGFDVILVDCPPRLDDRPFLQAVAGASLACIITGPIDEEVEAAGETYRAFKTHLPQMRVVVLLNLLEPNRRVTQQLDDTLKANGLDKAPFLSNSLKRREEYRHAVKEGWHILTPEAREPIALIAAELYKLANK